jgi:tryptophan halogenase
MSATNSDHRIRRILIVGGGTAGWLSAAYLRRALSPDTEITLVESSDVPPIGVGEATIPTLRFTFDFLGLDEAEWMRECNASYKMAIKFENWLHGQGEHYYHTFTNRSTTKADVLINPWGRPYFPDVGLGISPMHYWLAKKLAGEEVEPYAYACLPSTLLCEKKLAPRCPDHPELDRLSAYHFDAGLVAKYLARVAKERGVHHVIGHVADAEQAAEDGSITAVTTKDGRRLEADLFIDCSGFRSLLIEQTLKEPFLSDAQHLLVDSAIAIPSENHPERDGLNSYTIASAQRAGWTWDIPLFHRNGTGYVYSSQFIDGEAAEQELREFLGPRAAGASARHLRLRVGKMRNLWVKNCIAIGLSGSFLEPLESTSIFMTEYQLAQLVTFFPDKRFAPSRVRAYNDVLNDMYNDIRDFIVLHYVLSKRRDTPFWVEATRDSCLTDSLRERLEFFRENMPIHERQSLPLFKTISYAQILAGMDCLPEFSTPLLAHVDRDLGERALLALRQERNRALESLPSHYDYLKSVHDGTIKIGGTRGRSRRLAP